MFLTIAISSRYPPTNNQLRTSSNLIAQANIQDGRVVVQNAKDDRVRVIRLILEGSGYQEQHEFCAAIAKMLVQSTIKDLYLLPALPRDKWSKEKVEAYDSDYDDALTASAIFMAKLSPTGSISGDEARPSYDSDILFEVPNYDNYHENNTFNPFAQEFPDSKQPVLLMMRMWIF
ncbi:hypothetical protein Tco_0212984 [Tanacetum coccineum]